MREETTKHREAREQGEQLPTLLRTQSQLIERVQSEYQLIEIYEHPHFGKLLFTDRDFEIGELDESYNLALTSQLMCVSPLRNVAILGGGDGGVLRTLLELCDRAGHDEIYVELLEIDEKVIELCSKHMGEFSGNAFGDPRANIVIGDAYARIETVSELDAVIYDVSLGPIREDQTRTEWIEEVTRRMQGSLRAGGILAMICCRDPLAGGELDEDRYELLGDIQRIVPQYFTDVRQQSVYVPSYGEKLIFLSAQKPA